MENLDLRLKRLESRIGMIEYWLPPRLDEVLARLDRIEEYLARVSAEAKDKEDDPKPPKELGQQIAEKWVPGPLEVYTNLPWGTKCQSK